MSLRVALAQIDPCVGDLAGNAAIIVEQASLAAQAGARLVLFPEMALTGYPIEDLALRKSFQEATAKALSDLAQRLVEAGAGDCAVVVGSLGVSSDSQPTNTAAVLRGGQIEATYVKHRLPNYGVFDEYRLFAPGTEPVSFIVDGVRTGLAICEDIWSAADPTGPVAQYAAQAEPIDLLAVLNGSPFELGKTQARRDQVRACAHLLNAPVAYVNLVGGQDDLVFDGDSFVFTPDADLAAQADWFRDQTLLWQTGATAASIATLSPDEQVYRACVLGLSDYARKNGFTSAILGLSGGIDSALVAAMATDALGRGNVVGVSMPSVHSSNHSRDDAAELARRCGIDYRVEPIADLVAGFDVQLGLTGIAAENVQARVRGMILMGLSNMEGHLVLATGNKSELAVGYSTIYGDAVGGYAPLKDVFKTRVWSLARWRNAQAIAAGQIPPIPENSIAKAPSAELRPGQTDQDSLPPYDQLDTVLDRYIERAGSRTDLLSAGHPPAAVDLALRLTDQAEWKRRQYPPGPKVSGLAFGRDRRLPITNAWREP